MRVASGLDALRAIPMLAGLGEERLADLAERTEVVHLGAGRWLFREGDPGDSLFAVLSGRLQVVADGEDGPGLIRELVPGEAVGELALITGAPRSASVRARRDSELVRLGREDFDALLEAEPAFARALVRFIGAQLQATRVPIADRRAPSTIALLPLEPSAPVRDVADALTEALGALGTLARLDPEDRADARTAARLEDTHDRLLLVAGSTDLDDPWTRVCLGQADRVVALAARPGGGLAELRLADCDLAYVAAPGARPDPSGWVEAVSPRATHVLRSGAGLGESSGRLARRLAGRSVGLVLSGGGARAFAHLGIVEELEGAGLVVDRYAGTSMGALIAGLLALGPRGDELTEGLRREWSTGAPVDGRVFEMLERTFGPATIEGLDRDFFCCSADLTTQRLVVHRRGLVATAVGGSMALPGQVPPVPSDEGLLVDGGVLNNLPVEPMAQTGEGPIVAVDVAGEMPPPEAPRGRFPSVRRLIPGAGAEPEPRLGETILRTVLIGGAAADASARRRADVTIVPKLHGAGTLQFEQLDRIREIGREAGREALESGMLSVLEGRLG